MKRTTRECPICSRQISKSNYTKHTKVCNGEDKSKLSIDRQHCQFCKKLNTNKGSLVVHEKHCKMNPNRVDRINHLAKYIEENGAWNKGLTKETDKRLRKRSLSQTNYWKDNPDKLRKVRDKLNKLYQTEEYKKRHSEIMKRAVSKNPDSYSSNNVLGRVKSIEYKDTHVTGSWELEVAKSLDEQNISWTNKIDGIPYTFENQSRTYFPDFYLIDFDKYVEVKGFVRDKDLAKWKVLSNLIIIQKDEIRSIKNGTFNWIRTISNL